MVLGKWLKDAGFCFENFWAVILFVHTASTSQRIDIIGDFVVKYQGQEKMLGSWSFSLGFNEFVSFHLRWALGRCVFGLLRFFLEEIDSSFLNDIPG